MADDNETNGDEGWWDCSLCTYRNSAEKFKCEICDLRRGTSTRKPRCSTDTIVAQVVKQQEQIRQQTKVKPSPKKTSTRDNSSTPARESSSKPARESSSTPLRDNSSAPARERSVSQARDNLAITRREQPATPEPTTSSPHNNNHLSPASTITDASSPSSTGSMSPDSRPTTPAGGKSHQSLENTVKIRPIEINGNLIKYLPPTSTGRTGLIIDKKRFTQHSVTVDDVTITFTEFATRQNKYVRKKKKKSGKAAAPAAAAAGQS